MDIREPVLPLTDYLEGLDSPSLSWLSCLRINPHDLDRSDLVRTARLQNVAVLDLSDDDSIDDRATQMDERIFKTWAELAKDGQAFKHLRVILMRGQGAVSAWIFRYMDSFPSLCFLILSDCRRIHQKNRGEWTEEAASHGWEARHGKKSARSLKHLIEGGNFHLGSVSACYYHSQDVLDELTTPHQTRTLDHRLPVVEAWIGKPKPWLHLIEEFPGTRTVWFDNTKTKEGAGKAEVGTGTAAPALAGAARDPPLSERNKSQNRSKEEITKRTRNTMSGSGEDPKSHPRKRSTPTVRSGRKNLDQILADLG